MWGGETGSEREGEIDIHLPEVAGEAQVQERKRKE